jgi:hypothetical protein
LLRGSVRHQRHRTSITRLAFLIYQSVTAPNRPGVL